MNRSSAVVARCAALGSNINAGRSAAGAIASRLRNVHVRRQA